MTARCPHEHRRLAGVHKSNSMMDDCGVEAERSNCLPCNLAELMRRHFWMRFVFDSLNLAFLLYRTDDAQEIHNRSAAAVNLLDWLQSSLSQDNFTNGICHAL